MNGVRIGSDVEARVSGALSWVAASLPETLHLVDEGADVLALSGTAGWAERAVEALREGACGVVVIAPGAEAVDVLRTTAAELNASVVLDQRWRSNPAVVTARDAVSGLQSPICFADIAVNVQTIAEVEPALHESVQIAQYVIGTAENLRVLHRQSRTVLVSATVEGAPLTITIAVGPAIDSPCRVRVVALSGGVNLSVPDPETAAPGIVTIVHHDGATTLPTRWESAHRASWRRLAASFERGERLDDLGEFGESMEQLYSRATLT